MDFALNLEIIACCNYDCYYLLHLAEGDSGSCKGMCSAINSEADPIICISFEHELQGLDIQMSFKMWTNFKKLGMFAASELTH